MARGTPAAVVNPFRSESFRPVKLLWIEAGAVATPTARYTSYDADLTWGGFTWTRRPFRLGPIATHDVRERKGITIDLADADDNWQALLDDGADFEGKEVRVYSTDLDAIQTGGGGLADAFRDDFWIQAVTRTQIAVQLECASLLGHLDKLVPAGTVTRTEFPGIPAPNAT